MIGLDKVFGVRHHSKHVAVFVDYACNVVDGSVGIGSICITEHDLLVVLDFVQGVGFRKKIAVVMGNRAGDNLAFAVPVCKCGIRVFDFQLYRFTDESAVLRYASGLREAIALPSGSGNRYRRQVSAYLFPQPFGFLP